ncbi:hypothetical protein [Methanosarcina soligelidi]|uniref:hypothetical protein n=1 Tax=Methanosarcina soligelidi TaxID=1036677 RepID=UPI00069E2896|nr:hypothetical protein [Methanosarcina soligelidi]
MQENLSSNSDVQYNPSRRTKILLTGLLVILNIVMRIPSIPHEKGYDSFFIHSLANSVSNFGVAQWWINWMSVFGLYPYSYASAVPFTLSGMSQLTGIRMEIVILLFCIILGLFSIFASYSLAIVLYDNFLHRFLFAAIFSLSAGTLNLTTWEITTRAQMLVFFLFLLYFLFQIIKFKIKFLFLFIMTIFFLFANHHYVYLGLFYSFLIIVSALIYKFHKRTQISRYIRGTNLENLNSNYIYIATYFLLVIFMLLFGTKLGLITSESRYTWIKNIAIITGRNAGLVLPFAVSGFTYISLKKCKSMEEWILLICLLPTLIFSLDQTYGYITTYIFITLLGSVGLYNLSKNYKFNSKIVVITVIIFLILNVAFSTFFAHYRLGIGRGYSEWYMKEETYKTGEWIAESIEWDKKAVSNSLECNRLFASYGGQPAIYLDDINNYVNGFIVLNEDYITKNSIFSKEFYIDNPYILKSGTTTSGLYNWTSQYPITNKKTQTFITENNISYFFEDIHETNALFMSVSQNKSSIYKSGRMRIWIN